MVDEDDYIDVGMGVKIKKKFKKFTNSDDGYADYDIENYDMN